MNPKENLDVLREFGRIADASPTPMIGVAGAGHIVRYINAVACRLIGKREGDLIGNAFAAMVPVGDDCLAALDRVYQTGQPKTCTEQEPSAPNPFWSYAMWPALAMDDRAMGVIVQVTETKASHEQAVAVNTALMLGSVQQHELTEAAETLNAKLQTEIAERRRVEEELMVRNLELRQSRDFAQSIVESVWQPLIVLDPQMRIQNVNQAFYQCFHATREDTEGQLLFSVLDGQWGHSGASHPIKRRFAGQQIFRRFRG